MTDEQWQAIRLSLQVASASTLLSFPVAIFVATLLSKSKGLLRLLLDAVVNLPLVLPPVVTGYLLLVLFGKNRFIGALLYSVFGWEFVFDFKGAVLAASVVSFPLMVRAIRLAFDAVNPALLQASNTLGAGPVRTFCQVKLPLSVRGLAAGSMLAFARSLGEFGATIMVAGSIAGHTKTIPLFVYEELQTPGGIDNCWPVVAFSVLIAMLALFVSSKFESTSERPNAK